MAPKAQIMACRTKTSLGSPLPDTIAENTVMNAMQFCVAPPLSPTNHAHLLTMSLGWYHSWNPRRAVWRASVTNVAAAGLPYFIANGNEGSSSPPDNVRTPGDCPGPWHHPAEADGGRSGAISIGATDNADNIASFSSWGPVSWSGIPPYDDYPYPPGLLKPDFCAPGVNVTSCRLGGGYTQMSGTSMATPGAAGVCALIYTKNPELLPEEVDSIMQNSVLPLGTQPKNNTYGTGRIDAMLCIQNTPFPGPRHDIAIGEILAPTESIFPELPLAPVLEVKNLGDFVESGILVWCRVESAGAQVYLDTERIAVLDSLTSDTVAFASWSVGPGERSYDLTFWHTYSPDTVRRNDTARLTAHTLGHDVALAGMNIDSLVRANRPLSPIAYVKNVGGYVETSFKAFCRIDSGATMIYSESISVDTVGLGATKDVTFPVWNVAGDSVVYMVRMWHDCGPDQHRQNDTMTQRTVSSVGMIRVAIEIADSSRGRVAPNACYQVDSLCLRQGWSSTIVAGDDLDEWNELMNYDVIVTGDVGDANNDFAVYDNTLLRWVRSGGGFVGLGWMVFGVFQGPGPWSPMDTLCPVMCSGNYGYQVAGMVGITDTVHPITHGVGNFGIYDYGEYAQAGLWPGAVPLATYTDDTSRVSVACKVQGSGRAVYLGPIYFGDFATHNNQNYYTDYNSAKLLRQAIVWAASGPGAGVAAPPGGATPCAELEQARPSLFRYRTSLSYTIVGPGRVRLAVYDLAGKLVRTLADEVQSPGRREAAWDRTDDAGRPVACGVYFARFETEGFRSSRKLVVR
jgi:hypothetical protein